MPHPLPPAAVQAYADTNGLPPKAQPPRCFAPKNTASVNVRGMSWVVGYDTEPGEPEPVHYQHGTVPARGPVDFAVFVLMGSEWLDIDQVFAAPFIAELNAELNRIPNN